VCEIFLGCRVRKRRQSERPRPRRPRLKSYL